MIGFGKLMELWIDGSDSDQIWEQIQLTNEPFLQFLKKRIRPLPFWNGVVLAEEDSIDEEQTELDLTLLVKDSVSSVSEGEPNEGIVRKRNCLESEVFSDSDESESKRELVDNTRRSEVDDQFFKLSEMEAFLGRFDCTSCYHGYSIFSQFVTSSRRHTTHLITTCEGQT